MTRAGAWLLALAALLALGAPWLAVHPPDVQFRSHVFAPPMRLHVVADDGRWRAPFYYPIRAQDLASRTFREDRARPLSLGWFGAGRLASDDPSAPWFPLGTDSLGRDTWSRLVHGGRVSLGVAVGALLGALLLGTLVGGLAAGVGGWTDEALMRTTELVLVLPTLYVVLALRAAMPLVLPSGVLFLGLVAVLSIAGAPPVARGVRGLLVAEGVSEYAMAAKAIGATRTRVVVRHLLPAARPFLLTQALVLAPAFILAEATLSYVGLGFNPPTSSWGSMLQEATNIRAMAEFPWILAPAAAIVVVVLGLTLASEPRQR